MPFCDFGTKRRRQKITIVSLAEFLEKSMEITLTVVFFKTVNCWCFYLLFPGLRYWSDHYISYNIILHSFLRFSLEGNQISSFVNFPLCLIVVHSLKSLILLLIIFVVDSCLSWMRYLNNIKKSYEFRAIRSM